MIAILSDYRTSFPHPAEAAVAHFNLHVVRPYLLLIALLLRGSPNKVWENTPAITSVLLSAYAVRSLAPIGPPPLRSWWFCLSAFILLQPTPLTCYMFRVSSPTIL